jgi:hypothetical protein
MRKTTPIYVIRLNFLLKLHTHTKKEVKLTEQNRKKQATAAKKPLKATQKRTNQRNIKFAQNKTVAAQKENEAEQLFFNQIVEERSIT